ncbi:MAG: ATP-binding protein [Deltaproteobacteria bacterium]|nr:ATP-binding protein [Deltaproteobacteria bacterium]
MARVPFRTRARTVDHLGREQIADCPTAVSELWKNAYDAYATKAELHIFDGEFPVAAIVDDGHGMSADEFIDRWLMLGTETKLTGAETPASDRSGLPFRERQGQKGIGRLSVAFLGPTTIVLSKRENGPFVAAMIDWRLYQNPYLTLEDLRIPVEEFADPSAFPAVLAALLEGLIDNLWGSDADPARRQRLEAAWRQHSDDEERAGKPSSLSAIESLALKAQFDERHLNVWPTWRDCTKGSALYIFDVERELRVWIDGQATAEDRLVTELKKRLEYTLHGFVDPYAEGRADLRFDYNVVAHRGSKTQVVVASDRVFSLAELRDLEHVVEGHFDRYGHFRGRLRAWGKDLGEVSLPPSVPLPTSGAGYVGPIHLVLGTYEGRLENSSMPADALARVEAQSSKFSGLAIYRDGLRVQPYGRPDNDFFEIEERRAKAQGREFWVSRRSFGRIALTKGDNPNLRDKAGREGLIVNRAAGEFRQLIIDLLMRLARRYFGSDAELREIETKEYNTQFERAKAAEAKLRKRRVSDLGDTIKRNQPELSSLATSATGLVARLDSPTPAATDIEELVETVDRLRRQRAELALPPKPKKLTPALEERYRSYRDTYSEVTATIERASGRVAALSAELHRESPEELANSALMRHQKFITDATGRWKRVIADLLGAEQKRWMDRVAQDNSRYYELAAPLAAEVAEGRVAPSVGLAELDAIRERLFGELSQDYDGYVRSVKNLAENIDVDAALGWAADERVTLAAQVEQWQSLAQLGIAVEIVGHELNETAAQVSRNMTRLPAEARDTDAYKLAYSGFRSLVHRLEFLAPLRLSGPRLRESISGKQLFKYVSDFFARQAEARKTRFWATDAFLKTSLTEYPHRIFPVFVNLVNNALYWVTLGAVREVVLDRQGPLVIVADSGPGIDPDDRHELFRLFYTRRVGGHGVGLYLSRLALEQGQHRIRLAEPSENVLPGANFVIEFRDLKE